MVLDVDSLIELTLSDGVAYGVIRWIGMVPDRNDTVMCGLELVSLTASRPSISLDFLPWL